MTRSVPFDCPIASVWTANRFYRRVSPFMFRSFTFLASAFSLSSSSISIKAIGLQRMPFSSHSIRFRRCVQLDHPVSIEKMSIVAESILRADSEVAFSVSKCAIARSFDGPTTVTNHLIPCFLRIQLIRTSTRTLSNAHMSLVSLWRNIFCIESMSSTLVRVDYLLEMLDSCALLVTTDDMIALYSAIRSFRKTRPIIEWDPSEQSLHSCQAPISVPTYFAMRSALPNAHRIWCESHQIDIPLTIWDATATKPTKEIIPYMTKCSSAFGMW